LRHHRTGKFGPIEWGESVVQDIAQGLAKSQIHDESQLRISADSPDPPKPRGVVTCSEGQSPRLTKKKVLTARVSDLQDDIPETLKIGSGHTSAFAPAQLDPDWQILDLCEG